MIPKQLTWYNIFFNFNIEGPLKVCCPNINEIQILEKEPKMSEEDLNLAFQTIKRCRPAEAEDEDN